MISELFIEDSRVDISADISSLLNFAIDDVKDFGVRSTTWSKTVVLPGTSRNNALFGNIFETGSSNSYDPSVDNIGYNFNVSKSARCLIFQDNIQTFKGTIRMLLIVKDKGNIEYEMALNGELTGLNVALSSGYLTDLDFSAYNHVYSIANILASWDNPGGSGYYYPLIDYGNYSTAKKDWSYRTLRPALYVKEYIDKMFTAASYRYTSDLFNTARFEGLIVPHNQKELRYNASSIAAGTLSSQYLCLQTLDTTKSIKVTTFTSSAFSANAGKTVFTYTDVPTVTLTLNFHITGQYFADSADLELHLYKDGILQPGFDRILVQNGTSLQTFDWSGISTFSFATTDYIEFRVFNTDHFGNTTELYIDTVDFSITSASAIPVPANLGDTIPINDTLPKNVKQIDFLTSIVKLFNLYVYESQFDDRMILIKPYVDFYSTDSSNAVDWTYKLNRDQPVKIKPLSELNSKTYNFKFRDDSDYFNDLYKKRYNQGYGSYVYDSQFEFTSQESTLDLIFAATPLVGYASEDKVYPTIFKRTGEVTGVGEENTDSVIRILQTKKVTGVASWDIKDGATVVNSGTVYGYAGHFDDPDNPQNDLNFGVLKELFFTLVSGNLTVTQFNIYYSAYLSEITDKDSKMLTGKFYLTPKDIFSLDFSKYIFLDSVLFRLNKITDYNTTTPSDCEVELIKCINTIY